MPSALMSKVTSMLHLAAPGRADAVEDELAQQLVLDGPLALALEHGDADRGLVVLHRGEEVRLAGRDGRVLRDDGLEVAAHHQEPEVLRRDVEEQDLACPAPAAP